MKDIGKSERTSLLLKLAEKFAVGGDFNQLKYAKEIEKSFIARLLFSVFITFRPLLSPPPVPCERVHKHNAYLFG